MVLIFSLFFASALCAGNPSVLKTRIEKLARDQVDGALEVADASAPSEVLAATFSSKIAENEAQPFCGCTKDDMFSLYDIFQANDSTRTLDYHPVAQHQHRFQQTLTLTNWTIRTDTATTKWEAGSEVSLEYGGAPGLKGAVKGSFKYGKDTTETETLQLVTAQKYVCPRGKLCEVVVVSFTGKYKGKYYKMPVVDFNKKCVPSEIQWGNDKITPSSKIALASLQGKSDKWDTVGQKYFTTTQNAGEGPSGRVSRADIEFPPASTEIKATGESGEVEEADLPIYEGPGQLHTSVLFIEYAPKSKTGPKKEVSKRDSSDEASSVEDSDDASSSKDSSDDSSSSKVSPDDSSTSEDSSLEDLDKKIENNELDDLEVTVRVMEAPPVVNNATAGTQ